MSVHKLLLLPGDGIGPEITAEAEKVLALLNETGVARFENSGRPRGRSGLRRP